jgi:hypothetical protein
MRAVSSENNYKGGQPRLILEGKKILSTKKFQEFVKVIEQQRKFVVGRQFR